MADASSTSVNMSEDSEADEDDDDDAYSELDGVELYKEGSSAASTDDDDQEKMEAASAPKLSSSSASACPLKEVSHDMAALLDFAEYQDDVIQYLRSVDTKHTPKYQVEQPFITRLNDFSCSEFWSSSVKPVRLTEVIS